MDRFTVFTAVWQAVAVPLDSGTAQVAQSLSNWVDDRFQLCVGAYFVVMLLIAAWSSDEEAFQHFFRQIFLASVVFALAANAGTYNYYVTSLTHGTVSSISQAVSTITQNKQQVDANGFDILASRAFALGVAAYKQLPDYSLKTVALCILIGVYWFFVAISILLMFGVYLCAYVATDILLAVGPLFVALYFFVFTRQWFQGWLRNLMTGMLAQIFAVVVCAFFFATMESILRTAGRSLAASSQISGEVAIGLLLMLTATAGVCLLFNFIALYTVYMAASIAGGLAPPQPRMTRFGHSHASGGMRTGGNPALSAETTPSPANDAAPSHQHYAFNRTVGSAE